MKHNEAIPFLGQFRPTGDIKPLYDSIKKTNVSDVAFLQKIQRVVPFSTIMAT